MSGAKNAFSKTDLTNCCKSARDGFASAVLAHTGCLAAPAIAGMLGGSLSHNFMAATMYVTSPAIAMGATWGINHFRGHKTSVAKLGGAATIALAVAFGIHQSADYYQEGGHNSRDIDDFMSNVLICGPSRDSQ